MHVDREHPWCWLHKDMDSLCCHSWCLVRIWSVTTTMPRTSMTSCEQNKLSSLQFRPFSNPYLLESKQETQKQACISEPPLGTADGKTNYRFSSPSYFFLWLSDPTHRDWYIPASLILQPCLPLVFSPELYFHHVHTMVFIHLEDLHHQLCRLKSICQ